MKGDKEDLIAIKDAVHTWTLIRKRVLSEPKHMFSPSPGNGNMEDWGKLEALIGRIRNLTVLGTHISEVIDEEALGTVKMAGPADLSSFREPGDLDSDIKADKRQPIFTIRPRYELRWHPGEPIHTYMLLDFRASFRAITDI